MLFVEANDTNQNYAKSPAELEKKIDGMNLFSINQA